MKYLHCMFRKTT